MINKKAFQANKIKNILSKYQYPLMIGVPSVGAGLTSGMKAKKDAIQYNKTHKRQRNVDAVTRAGAIRGALFGGILGLSAAYAKATSGSGHKYKTHSSGGWGGASRAMKREKDIKDAYKFYGFTRSPKVRKVDLLKKRKEYARKFHPDLNPNNPDALKNSQKANAAWDTISKTDKEFFSKLSHYLIKRGSTDCG